MRNVDLNELRNIQIEILQYVDNFCRKNDINYWIDAGTLLGAIRHKGYIPWDDDIDIGMLRQDYEKFVDLFCRDESRYQCCTIERTPNHYYGFAKIYDTKTVLYEPDKKSGRKMSIFIDLFVYDNVVDSPLIVKKMYKKRDQAMTWYRRRIEPDLVTGSGIKRLFGTVLRYCLQPIPVSFFRKQVIKNMEKYKDEETGYVGNFSGSMQKVVCSKKIFDSFIDVEFEGEKYMAPVGYDEWLKAFFGDYMQLPPEEKRVSHHSFEAYIED